MWEKLERTVLDNLSPEVQEDYGQDYILSERSFLNLMKTCTDPDISPVLLDVRHAICAQSPFAFYAPGKLSYLWLCFASVSPTGIFDYFHTASLGMESYTLITHYRQMLIMKHKALGSL